MDHDLHHLVLCDEEESNICQTSECLHDYGAQSAELKRDVQIY